LAGFNSRRARNLGFSLVICGAAAGAGSISSRAAAAPEAPSAPRVSAGDAARPEDVARAAALAAVPAPVVELIPRFAPDGHRVAFVANYSGQRALYVQDLDTRAQPRKVGPVERFRRPGFSPDGKQLYFTADRGGDEAFAIKRIDLATGEIADVAAGEALRRDGPWFVGSGERFLFSARPLAGRGLTLFEQPAAPPATPTRVFQDDDLWLAEVRPDGRQIVVAPELSDTLLLVDLPGGPPRRIYPAAGTPAGRADIQDVAYAADGGRLFVAISEGERLHVLALDPRTGREERRYTDPAVPGGTAHALQARGGSVAFVVDFGTHHELRVLDTATLAPRPTPRLPLGSEVPGAGHPNSTHGLSLSADGRRLAVQWSTPAEPARVYLVDTATGAHAPLTDVARPPATPVAAELTRVKSFDGLEVPVLVYGADASGGGKRPVIMSIHGGFAFASTSRFDPNLTLYVAEGYVVVEPNVRGSAGFGTAYERADDGVKKLDGVRDFRAVAEWIAKQPWADAGRMAVMGGSAGGYYTLLCLEHQPETWRAGVALVPLYDLQAALNGMDGDLRNFMSHELVPPSEPGILAAISPSTYVDRIRAPVFVYAGANDVRTPTAQIDPLVRALRDRGRPVEYMLAAGEGHSAGAPATRAELQARILRFLREALK
jgi:dipeptidyl aminopeptidase/acylaminoacyl peptidase